jgi:hypothetical protein
MEEYEGVEILANNLRKNMDDAFVRHLHFTVEFPFPDRVEPVAWRTRLHDRPRCVLPNGRGVTAEGERQAAQLHNALPIAEHAADPVKSAVSPPPSGALPGATAPVSAAPAGAAWNGDEAAIVERVSNLGKSAVQRLTKLAGALGLDGMLTFAEHSIARLQAIIGNIRQKVEAARSAVTKWIDDRLKPVCERIQKIGQLVSEKIDAAKQAISK